jgi:hypothetical protein
VKAGAAKQVVVMAAALTAAGALDGSLRLHADPAGELEQLREKIAARTNVKVESGEAFTLRVNAELFDVVRVIDGDSADLRFENGTMRYRDSNMNGEPVVAADGKIHCRLLVDRPVIELFSGRGRSQHVEFRTPGAPVRDIAIINTGRRPMTIERIELYRMKSIWPKPPGR